MPKSAEPLPDNPRWQDQQCTARDGALSQSASGAITNDQTRLVADERRRSGFVASAALERNSCLSSAQWDYLGSYVIRGWLLTAAYKQLLFSLAVWLSNDLLACISCVFSVSGMGWAYYISCASVSVNCYLNINPYTMLWMSVLDKNAGC